MSETRAHYRAGASPISLDVFKGRRCALPFDHPDYVAPSPAEVKQLIQLMPLTGSEVARLVGLNKDPHIGSRAVRRWTAPEDSAGYRTIPYSAWRLLLHCAGVVSVECDLLGVRASDA